MASRKYSHKRSIYIIDNNCNIIIPPVDDRPISVPRQTSAVGVSISSPFYTLTCSRGPSGADPGGLDAGERDTGDRSGGMKNGHICSGMPLFFEMVTRCPPAHTPLSGRSPAGLWFPPELGR